MALNGVSLDADDGELVAIVGPNGAGKTALLNCINGVYRPATGRIVLNGRNITHVPVDKIALARVGRAFQHAELFPHMTVSENLLIGRHLLMRTGLFSGALYFGRARREEAEQRKHIERIIDFFELYRYRDAPAASLPYGVQKLVGVARALSLEPKLLLLDEPSTGLMREEKESFARFLLRIRHELKLSMLWVEHDMQMVADLSDRIVVLNQGEVIANGLPDQVRSMPEVIKAYLGADAAVT
jgi:branched-chain amino acid transport system ATP-binding protein